MACEEQIVKPEGRLEKTQDNINKFVEDSKKLSKIVLSVIHFLLPFILFSSPIIVIWVINDSHILDFSNIIKDENNQLPDFIKDIDVTRKRLTYISIAVGLFFVCLFCRPLPFLLFFAPLLLVCSFLDMVPTGADDPARDLVEVMQRIPSERRFWILLSGLIGSWLARFWYMYSRLQQTFESRDNEPYRGRLTNRSWWATHEIRKRALFLRIRADLIFGFVLVLLFGGGYFAIFGLREVQRADEDAIRLAEQSAIFKERYREELESIKAGDYWIEVAGGSSQSFELLERWTSEDDSQSVLVGRNGVVLITEDEGRIWQHFKLALKPEEKLLEAWFDKDGSRSVLVGRMGSVFVKSKKGDGWGKRETELELEPRENLVEAWFAEDGSRSVLVGRMGRFSRCQTWGSTICRWICHWSHKISYLRRDSMRMVVAACS